MSTHIVLKIDTLEMAELAGYIDSDLRILDFETEMKNNFLILGFPSEGRVSLVRPLIFEKHFEPIEESDPIPIARFTKKIHEEVDPLRKTPFIQES